ncbi:hypothetical protein L2E82_16223 [Cichorium intybus]|uniref:Uncharacterized protein n=1 Tax=Cichorium intybus TaxID=13427 RepID=A0ACB9F4X8_CICIN|nr:hypothetical protein L2E82_16223 [Cichorium intybus]
MDRISLKKLLYRRDERLEIGKKTRKTAKKISSKKLLQSVDDTCISRQSIASYLLRPANKWLEGVCC